MDKPMRVIPGLADAKAHYEAQELKKLQDELDAKEARKLKAEQLLSADESAKKKRGRKPKEEKIPTFEDFEKENPEGKEGKDEEPVSLTELKPLIKALKPFRGGGTDSDCNGIGIANTEINDKPFQFLYATDRFVAAVAFCEDITFEELAKKTIINSVPEVLAIKYLLMPPAEELEPITLDMNEVKFQILRGQYVLRFPGARTKEEFIFNFKQFQTWIEDEVIEQIECFYWKTHDVMFKMTFVGTASIMMVKSEEEVAKAKELEELRKTQMLEIGDTYLQESEKNLDK
jgi:hypothetical protein